MSFIRTFSINEMLIVLTITYLLITMYYTYIIAVFFDVYIKINVMPIIILPICYLICFLLLKYIIFPVFKIEEKGITVYNPFRKKEVKWEEIRSARLLMNKTENKNFPIPFRMWVEWEYTDKPVNAGWFMGRTNTYAVLSPHEVTKPEDGIYFKLSINKKLMADKNTIAFGCDQKTWDFIQSRMQTSTKQVEHQSL